MQSFFFSKGNGDTFALLVGGIVGGVVITACLIFSLCIICYLHTICCSKPSPHHTPTSTRSDSSSKKKEVMYTSTLPPDVIKSLDAPPPYSGMNINSVHLWYWQRMLRRMVSKFWVQLRRMILNCCIICLSLVFQLPCAAIKNIMKSFLRIKSN